MKIHDAHCHFFSRAFFAALARETGEPAATHADGATAVTSRLGWDDPGTDDDLADRWVAALDTHHVARAMLIASVPTQPAIEAVGAAVTRHPHRFVGAFMVDPTRPETTELTEGALRAWGFSCVCLFPAMHHYALDDARVSALVDTIERHATRRAAVFVHCGVLALGVRKKLGLPSRFDIRRGRPLDVLALAQRYPHVPFVIPHFGAGFFSDALMAADLASNIYLDTSSSNGWTRYHPNLSLADVLRQTLAVLGPERLLFGTDSSFFPRGWQRSVWRDQAVALEDCADWPDAVTRVMTGTFEFLFGSTGFELED
jgi:predicted TIM-barrel fold metal-dependent hydrolase